MSGNEVIPDTGTEQQGLCPEPTPPEDGTFGPWRTYYFDNADPKAWLTFFTRCNELDL